MDKSRSPFASNSGMSYLAIGHSRTRCSRLHPASGESSDVLSPRRRRDISVRQATAFSGQNLMDRSQFGFSIRVGRLRPESRGVLKTVSHFDGRYRASSFRFSRAEHLFGIAQKGVAKKSRREQFESNYEISPSAISALLNLKRHFVPNPPVEETSSRPDIEFVFILLFAEFPLTNKTRNRTCQNTPLIPN